MKREELERETRETTTFIASGFAEIRKDLEEELRALDLQANSATLTPEETARRNHILSELYTIEKQISEKVESLKDNAEKL